MGRGSLVTTECAEHGGGGAPGPPALSTGSVLTAGQLGKKWSPLVNAHGIGQTERRPSGPLDIDA